LKLGFIKFVFVFTLQIMGEFCYFDGVHGDMGTISHWDAMLVKRVTEFDVEDLCPKS
jgi:hypothetical protein